MRAPPTPSTARAPKPAGARLPGRGLAAALAALSVWSAPLAARAASLLSGRLFTVPEKVYVSQAFELHFELEVTAGSEVEDLRISDFPNNPDILTLGRLETASRTSVTRDGQAVTVLHFKAAGRGHEAFAQTFRPRLDCSLVQRRSAGFFSSWHATPAQLQLAPFTLHIVPLPQTGRPASFGGAVGTFRLSGRLSQPSARPGDIVTLHLDLSGEGWLGQAPVPAPPASPLFKSYPAKESLREPLHVRTEQVLIPLSTNATEVAAVRFAFFNPARERYEESVAGPFPLAVSDAAPESAEPGIRVIDTSSPAPGAAAPPAVVVERVGLSLLQALPLLIGCAAAALAGFVFFSLRERHPRLAAACAAAVLAAGLAAGYAGGGKAARTTQPVARAADARFAPSRAAAKLFALAPGTPVTPVETAGGWVRVDAGGRRGWIPAEALAAPEPQGASPSPADEHAQK